MNRPSSPATAISYRPLFQRVLLFTAMTLCGPVLRAQTANPTVVPVPAVASNPIAVVSLDSHIPGSAAMVTGALQVSNGKAMIASNGTVTAGPATTVVDLPQRGTLNVCASTTVKLSADATVPAGETPGILMAMDHGAVEASFATGRNADILLTPDFRILNSGPGNANVKVRLGQGGDTCVDNPGSNAPYVLVTSVFDGSVYRVQPGQRVMFQHGNLKEVVDQEKEPCGCPPAQPQGNDFPLAQSEGLAPLPPAKPAPARRAGKAPPVQPLVFNANDDSSAATPQTAASPATTTTAPSPTQPAHRKKSGLFARIGHFFRRIFGAE
ncbi:MAG: hypothetical protein WBY75_17245 [Terracidiphilus sp.]